MPPRASLDEILTEKDEREIAKRLFNRTWELLENEHRAPGEDDEMLHSAHASACHWRRVGKPENLARGEWQCSRVYAVLGRAEPSLHHARRVLEICELHGIGDFDLAFAYEALARAVAVAGNAEEARAMVQKALAAADAISDSEDRDLLLADLETVPGVERFW